MKTKVPDRWEKYLPMGCRVPGTRFIPFKVPLKLELCGNQPESERFTPSTLLRNMPMLKAVIDLTNTTRYYNSEEFTSNGVLYKKINIFGGGKIPPKKICEEFFDAVDQLCRRLDHDSDALIGVHCTHGLNRTGYLICKYMVLRMKIDPQEAINKFQEARGYEIERRNYVHDIMSESTNWRSELSGSHSRRHYSVQEQRKDAIMRSSQSDRDRRFSRLPRLRHSPGLSRLQHFSSHLHSSTYVPRVDDRTQHSRFSRRRRIFYDSEF